MAESEAVTSVGATAVAVLGPRVEERQFAQKFAGTQDRENALATVRRSVP